MFRLHEIFDFLAMHEPDAVIVRDTKGRQQSRREFVDRANQLAHQLAAAGLQRGDRFAVLAKNCIEYPLFYLAASRAGAVMVPLNYRLAPAEWTFIVNDAGAQVLFVGADYVEPVAGIASDLTDVEQTVALADLEAWVADQPTAAPDVEIPTDDVVIQMYTSGTTGRPKGVMLTHAAITSNLTQIMLANPTAIGFRCQVVAPLYHVGATITGLSTVAGGGSLYIHEDFVPDEVVRVLDEEGIELTFLVPAMIQALLVFVPDVAERSYTNLRQIGYGASPISEETLRQAIEVFDCDFSQGFGQTESTAMLTYLSPDDHRRAVAGERPELLRSAGRAAPATQLRIVDEDGNVLGPNATGEVIARGPQLMKGYWNLPDATESALRDGWLYTGDAGCLDEEGYLFIQDRIKDMIVSGGENVYPAEIEQVLFEHPAIADAAVIGVPSDKWGEAVHAVVQLRPDASATEQEIIDYCRDKLAGYKRPASVEFIDEIPRNASMKVLKKDLRAPHWEGRERSVN